MGFKLHIALMTLFKSSKIDLDRKRYVLSYFLKDLFGGILALCCSFHFVTSDYPTKFNSGLNLVLVTSSLLCFYPNHKSYFNYPSHPSHLNYLIIPVILVSVVNVIPVIPCHSSYFNHFCHLTCLSYLVVPSNSVIQVILVIPFLVKERFG